jgi:hypothetical protein
MTRRDSTGVSVIGTASPQLTALLPFTSRGMSDYDDYFTDDIFLDDQTLAILDHEEQKYLTQAVKPAPPPTKRQRTDNGWTAGIGTEKAPLNVSDRLPEISVSLDGSYGVLLNASKPPTPVSIPSKPLPAKNDSSARAYPNQQPAPTSRPAIVQRAPTLATSRNTSASHVQHQSHSRPHSSSQSRPPAFQRQTSRGSTAQAAANLRIAAIPPSRLPSPSNHVANHVDQSHELEKQLVELRQKLEQVSFTP